MPKNPVPTVIIEVRGGTVVNVTSDLPIEYEIKDYDNMEEDSTDEQNRLCHCGQLVSECDCESRISGIPVLPATVTNPAELKAWALSK